jgi:hypothetical protein
MVTIQGQRFSPNIGLIEQLLAENPGWGRSRLSVRGAADKAANLGG